MLTCLPFQGKHKDAQQGEGSDGSCYFGNICAREMEPRTMNRDLCCAAGASGHWPCASGKHVFNLGNPGDRQESPEREVKIPVLKTVP